MPKIYKHSKSAPTQSGHTDIVGVVEKTHPASQMEEEPEEQETGNCEEELEQVAVPVYPAETSATENAAGKGKDPEKNRDPNP